jgi:hypothetical protein
VGKLEQKEKFSRNSDGPRIGAKGKVLLMAIDSQNILYWTTFHEYVK